MGWYFWRFINVTILRRDNRLVWDKWGRVVARPHIDFYERQVIGRLPSQSPLRMEYEAKWGIKL